MKRLFALLLFMSSLLFQIHATENWTAKRITANANQNASNTWIDFRRDIELGSVPGTAVAQIACDSKYWLWINGKMVVFEGQLKRGPNPNDTYYDEVDMAPFLQKGKNSIAVLLWYFGKDGFSHKSSGEAGLVFQCDAINLISDGRWSARLDKAFEDAGPPGPNYRLPESNLRFNAQKGDFDWTQPDGKLTGFSGARSVGKAESPPWNNLILRPIPLWKDYGIRDYENEMEIPGEGTGEWIECKLPYNCHVTPILDIDAPAGLEIKMQTDNTDYMGALDFVSVQAEYVTKEGKQEYESLGWMNGHVVKYLIPKGVKIKSLKYRETGFDCDFTGYFKCSDKFYERLWQKSLRTLYVTMRDTYMDCPDRERAQWWGDEVNESGESFYALSPSANTLTQKGILELINWQREDGTIFSPVPAGNWNQELPGQMLASIGYFGFWNYYMNTGDKETIAKVYKGVKRYLDVWQIQENGILVPRKGNWYWGDWGKKIDRQLLFNAWYYLALKGYLNMSELLGETGQVQQTKKAMEQFKTAFNSIFLDGNGYRTAEYEGIYDDRVQALAVVSGLADKDKYDKILQIFKDSYLSSPYMEKYVLEALFVMGRPEFGLERMKKRYQEMVDISPWTTLNEHWSGGTNNHAWSGGGLTILSQYVCGLYPIEPGWKSFVVKPQLGNLDFAETGNETVAGKVSVKITRVNSGLDIEVIVPDDSVAKVYVPEERKKVSINGKKVVSKEKDGAYNLYWLNSGTYKLCAR